MVRDLSLVKETELQGREGVGPLSRIKPAGLCSFLQAMLWSCRDASWEHSRPSWGTTLETSLALRSTGPEGCFRRLPTQGDGATARDPIPCVMLSFPFSIASPFDPLSWVLSQIWASLVAWSICLTSESTSAFAQQPSSLGDENSVSWSWEHALLGDTTHSSSCVVSIGGPLPVRTGPCTPAQGLPLGGVYLGSYQKVLPV